MVIERVGGDPLLILKEHSFALTAVRHVKTRSLPESNIPFDTLLASVKQNWWIYLSLAAQHYYYDVLSLEQYKKIWSRSFMLKDNLDTILLALVKMFQKVECFIARTGLNDYEILNIQVCGIKNEGRAVFEHLIETNIFAKEVHDFYNFSTVTSDWEEGLYSIRAEEPDIGFRNPIMEELICNPYFRSLDVTPFIQGHRPNENILKYVLNLKERCYLLVNKVPDSICTKTLIWL